jgi:hypothetical protein
MYLGSPRTGMAMQYPHQYLAQQQKQLEEEQKLLTSQRQIEHEQLLDHQRNVQPATAHLAQSSSPQKYFPTQRPVDQGFLQQHFQQQQQMIRQQAQMQQQYLLQGGNRSSHSLGGYLQANYHGMSSASVDPTATVKSSPPQLPQFMHMMSNQRAALEQRNKPVVGIDGSPGQRPTFTVNQQHQYPGIAFLPNGGNVLPGQSPNPYSPLRHFKPHF